MSAQIARWTLQGQSIFKEHLLCGKPGKTAVCDKSGFKRTLSVLARARLLEIELPWESKDSWFAAMLDHKLKTHHYAQLLKHPFLWRGWRRVNDITGRAVYFHLETLPVLYWPPVQTSSLLSPTGKWQST